MHRIFRVKAYEQEHGPHFDEVMAHKAVSKMENEDGSRGPHWSIEETTALASQHGISLSNRFNRYDWYVALNMIYSDFYKVIVSISNSDNVRHFIEFAKAWLADKDIDEGKMWYYYVYVMCDKIRKAEMECYEEEVGRKRFDEEMNKCQALLDKLNAYQEQPKEDPKIRELQNEVNELKNIIKQASQMVPQPMKSMLPENMQNVMNEVDQ